jgi:hypothetical protein
MAMVICTVVAERLVERAVVGGELRKLPDSG